MIRPVLWIATTNKEKIAEYKMLLPTYEIKTLADLTFSYQEPEESGATFAENAFLKARDLAQKLQVPVLGDDSGICVEALKGFPGVYSKRWAAPLTDWPTICACLLTKVNQSPEPQNRQAKMVTVLALVEPTNLDQPHFFEGVESGTLSAQVELGNGRCFGYDLIFQPRETKKTYSQMAATTKNQTSARSQAVAKFQKYWTKELLKNVTKD